MQVPTFNPLPLLSLMASAIHADYGWRGSVQIAEQAIARLHRSGDTDALAIWLDVHALLHSNANFGQTPQALH